MSRIAVGALAVQIRPTVPTAIHIEPTSQTSVAQSSYLDETFTFRARFPSADKVPSGMQPNHDTCTVH